MLYPAELRGPDAVERVVAPLKLTAKKYRSWVIDTINPHP
jgi:hypothetical protein